MTKFARGIIEFNYDIEDYFQDYPFMDDYRSMTKKELIEFFVEKMVDDIVDIAWSDLAPCIEMEIVDEFGEVINDEVSEVQA